MSDFLDSFLAGDIEQVEPTDKVVNDLANSMNNRPVIPEANTHAGREARLEDAVNRKRVTDAILELENQIIVEERELRRLKDLRKVDEVRLDNELDYSHFAYVETYSKKTQELKDDYDELVKGQNIERARLVEDFKNALQAMQDKHKLELIAHQEAMEVELDKILDFDDAHATQEVQVRVSETINEIIHKEDVCIATIKGHREAISEWRKKL